MMFLGRTNPASPTTQQFFTACFQGLYNKVMTQDRDNNPSYQGTKWDQKMQKLKKMAGKLWRNQHFENLLCSKYEENAQKYLVFCFWRPYKAIYVDYA